MERTESQVREIMTAFWLDPDHRSVASWTEHHDINRVMLATCLLPDGYLRFAERP